MEENIADRQIIIRSRVVGKQHFSDYDITSVRHILIDWFPRAIYADLTNDLVRVDVNVRKDYAGAKKEFEASFIRGDGSEVAKKSYLEEKLQGYVCYHYDSKKSRYPGVEGEFDCREVSYVDSLMNTIPMHRP